MNHDTNTGNPTTPNLRGPDPGYNAGRGRTPRQGKPKPKWNRSKQQKNAFVGKTKEMQGHVFQLHAEQKRKGQFRDTLD